MKVANIEGTGKAEKLGGTTGEDVINGAGGNDLIVGATGFTAGQELLVDGSFESARVGAGTWTWFKQVGGWQSDSGVEVWGKNFIKAASHGDKLLELDFDNRTSKVWQDVKTEAGQEYSFSFDASARPSTSLGTNTINVYWNDKLVGTVNPGATWQSNAFKLVGTGGTDRIEFRESANQNDSYGGLIDNVSLKATKVAAHNLLIGGGGSDQIVAGQHGDVMFGDGPKSGRVDASKLKITEGVKAHVTWQGESAGYKNALGMYTFDKDGNITGVKILFANASEVGSGGDLVTGQSGVDVDLKGGERVGFFVAANAYHQKGMDKLLSDGNATFMLVDAKTGKPGVVGQGGEFKLVHVDAKGVATDIKTQYGTSIFTSSQANNGDKIKHDVTTVDPTTGKITVGFEDLWGGGDRDFDDTRFTIDIGVANAAQVGKEGAPSIGKSAADDLMIGGKGDDTVFGMRGNDTLRGGDGNDKLFGGSGDDVLSGGSGNNTLYGNSGNDRFLVDEGTNTVFGGSGFDTIDFSGASSGVKLDLSKHVATGGANATMWGVEGVVGTKFADVLRGDKNANVIDGGAGNDVIRGAAGADLLTGGSGSDSFVFHLKDVVDAQGKFLGTDRITDFSKEDTLDLRGVFKGQDGNHADLVKLVNDAQGTHVFAKTNAGYFEVATLDGVHHNSAAEMMKAGMLLV
jgi:Ca2+-binding RTX toxin-like protein